MPELCVATEGATLLRLGEVGALGLNMAYLQGLAARFVEQDGLSAEEQDNIITEVADCQLFYHP